MKYLFTIFLAIGIGHTMNAQDIHYTQINQNNMMLNPALTGMFEGWERVGVNHRSQWISTGTKFHTTTISADLNLLKPKRGNKAYMGVGLLLYNDIGGDSRFGTRQILFNMSAVVPIADMHTISAGIQGGMGQRTGDFTELVFGNQWDGNEFNSHINPNENNALVSKAFADLGFGVNYRYGNYKLGFARDDATELRIGFAYFHANKPDISYNVGFKEALPGKMAFNGSFLKDISGSSVGFHFLFNHFIQGPHQETMIGSMLRYRISSASKTTGLKKDTYLIGGLMFRAYDAIAPVIYLQWKGFNFGCSYDVTISKLGQATRFGAIEFSLSYTNNGFALFKRRTP